MQGVVIIEATISPAGKVQDARVLRSIPLLDQAALERLEAAGRDVRRWPAQHHYFGGVSAVGRSGCAGDPRRSGHAALLLGPARRPSPPSPGSRSAGSPDS